ncbi:tRNA (adenosine(37)-N6)-threonylcarbamoyltransferase complex dimerization subunit type 1 TsaB [Wolbachia endosymbiont of Drosophila mauritiana]|uniref:tRNA (adenosine(37)-N6)-threonylcarbamoyltransferase complex dimerization subunit type 1 TsaB n=1 Tax=unclassified Wolbachia TaxID=2640676 RepID=UPI00107E6D0F|nr:MULTISPECIES: tRNA (adenosine(37)-N6)-threonylcarbamoyltransferase complex dimerization subunit type 1 TsaB [unclassified Wolbachia]QCB62538.1 tRNA (adenosine(37)-N6)-threonylcarbamoyltransferase complex dimerization subunit type 1 TsaB [Wolbachia endosymbiont of Drosophila mauritiana]QCB63585.1 tRNA (adenosine(37)-N6)-threonylcarbamoyltransferase complex dimerization subunit type 1 TsaB [Wolbachia endosymbiont of Drosophila mauritiana]QWE33138.1 Putative glycoprotease [Wolbachia endosymbiont
MSILAINTVGAGSSIAVIDYDGNCFVERNSANNSHAESFFQILSTLFSKYNYNYDKIDHLVVVVGPGSFTGIRVGISAAQGINLATNKPLYGVSALEAQAYAISLLCANSKKNIKAIIEDDQKFYTQLFDFNLLLPLSNPAVVSELQPETDCITYMDCSLPKLDASHAGLLVRYRLKNKQKLNGVEALYLNEPHYMKSLPIA